MRALAVGVIAAAMAAAGSPVGAQDAARSGADSTGSQVVDITREPSHHASTHAESCTEVCAEPSACLVAGDAGDAVGATPCPTAMRLAAADQWRVLTVTLPMSGDLVLPDTVGPVLLVAVSDVQLAFARPHGGGGMRGEAGVLGWIGAPPGAASAVVGGPAGHGAGRGGSRVVTNEGAKPARLVLLEFRRMAPAVPAG